MNETDSSGPESNNNSDEWKSWPPEFFLLNLVYELRTPLMMIKGYAEILGNETMKEHHPRAIESISKTTEKMEKILEGIAEYRNELERRS